MQLAIRDMELRDIDSVCKLLTDVITATYRLNNIKNDDLAFFIEEKIANIQKFARNEVKSTSYKVAIANNRIIGVGGIYPLCDDILNNIDDSYNEELEIGSLYIDVNYQKKGVAKRLMAELIAEIEKMNKELFFLDCGYKSSQLYWENIFGTPYRKLESYFSKNEHYLIWKIEINEGKRLFSDNPF